MPVTRDKCYDIQVTKVMCYDIRVTRVMCNDIVGHQELRACPMINTFCI